MISMLLAHLLLLRSFCLIWPGAVQENTLHTINVVTNSSYLPQRIALPVPYHVTGTHLNNVMHPQHLLHHQM